LIRQLFIVSMALWLVTSTQAQGLPKPEAGTLAKIRELGVVFLGHRESTVPFSYGVGPDNRPTGYAVEICERVIDGIGKRLALPDLKMIPVPLPTNLRFTMLINGIVDMECGASINTKIRQQRMAFSLTFFEATTKFLVAEGSSLNRIKDMDGKVVAIIAGTTAGRSVSTLANRRGISVRQVGARDRGDALQMLVEGKADAFLSDDALILGALLGSKYHGKLRLMEESISVEPYGIALRRDDPEFKKMVDEILLEMFENGEMTRLYAKWFMEPVPPSGKSMNLPLDDRNLQLFANPNDRGV
jgi:glutamate/aspartate transport system substrate-binding protein